MELRQRAVARVGDAAMSEPTGAAGHRERLDELRKEILDRVSEYHALQVSVKPPFHGGRELVPYAGRVHDDREMRAATEAVLEFWLTAGRWSARLERRLATEVGQTHCRLVNSGSSANLVEVTALTSPLLGERALRPGDEVLTVAAGFPTTVAPIVQNRLVPVFVDVDSSTGNADVDRLREAVGPRTRAVVMAHTLGNPFDLDAVTALCDAHDLFLVEDNCDALGSTYTSQRPGSDGSPRPTGGFGHISTSSFYPAHHITTGEGGAVYVSDPDLERAVTSLRDWGRDCWCDPGKSDTCGKRFCQQFGTLPFGYDHKYVYSHLGYNLKMTDLQAAIGVAQLDRLDEFTQRRRHNHDELIRALEPWADVLQLPEATPHSTPSWFAYLMLVREQAPFTRDELVAHLEENRVQTRMLFAGNLLHQPAMSGLEAGRDYRVVGPLDESDRVMTRGLLVGVYPGLDDVRIDYICDVLQQFLRARTA